MTAATAPALAAGLRRLKLSTMRRIAADLMVHHDHETAGQAPPRPVRAAARRRQAGSVGGGCQQAKPSAVAAAVWQVPGRPRWNPGESAS